MTAVEQSKSEMRFKLGSSGLYTSVASVACAMNADMDFFALVGSDQWLWLSKPVGNRKPA